MPLAVVLLALLALLAVPATTLEPLDKAAQQWVAATLKKLTLEQLVGQMIWAPLNSTYMSSDSDEYEALVKLIHESHIGGVIAFGGTEPVPQVMLNPTYGPVILGQPMELASIVNRLQSISALPLLTASDFEWGVNMRIAGATRFPRAMAFGAAGDEQLAYEAGKITAVESRALGVHVDFGPVADVNNNARNPVINIRSFGEDPAAAGTLVAAWVRGLQEGGVLATLKHFPGHGDTDVDSHLGLPLISHPRERLQAVELPPFKSGITAGAAGVMVAHIEMPAVDSEKGPATFSHKIVSGLLRDELAFSGLIYSDSMKMDAITRIAPAGAAAVRAVKAGIDVVLDSPDSGESARAIVAAVNASEIPRARIEQSARRILEAKARLGLHRTRTVSFDALPTLVGGRRHKAVARAVSERSITLIKDTQAHVPLPTPRTGRVLYLSVLDYPSGWRVAAPSRTVIPQIRARWPNTDSVEVSDRTTPSEFDLVRRMTADYDAIVAGVFVRSSSGSGRLDLAPQVAEFLGSVAQAAGRRSQPFVSVFFGNPYTPVFVPQLPAMLLTFDFSDVAEESAVRALAGEIPTAGKLPIALPGMFPIGHGITRGATR